MQALGAPFVAWHAPLPCPPVGHADEQDVVQRIHTVNLGQQLQWGNGVGRCGQRLQVGSLQMENGQHTQML